MAGKGEYLTKEMTCDICDFKGTGREVGSHISHAHYEQLLVEAQKQISEAGRRGVTRLDLQKATGWTQNRVASLTKALERQGAVVSNKRHPLRYYDSSVRAKVKTTSTSNGGAIVSVEAVEVSETIQRLTSQANAKLVERAKARATAELVKRHQVEFQKLFVSSLIEAKVSTMNLGELETLLDSTFKTQ